MKKIKNKKILIIILVVIFTISVILLLPKNKNKNFLTYDKYSSKITVELLKEDNSSLKHLIAIKGNEKLLESTSTLLETPLYINNKGSFYLKGGRYQNIDSSYSYKNIYSTINKIDLNENEGSFHPVISKEIINEILDNLFIDYSVKDDITCNLTLENNRIKEFSIFLNDVPKLKRLGITITYEKLDPDYRIKTPIFYKDAIDLVDNEILKIL